MKTILIVEDDAKLRDALQLKLTQEGFSVLQAENGAVALQIINQKPVIDLILLDLLMPEMDGQTFVYKLSNELKKSIPIIILTNLMQSSIPDGCNKVLIKSDTPLSEIVEEIRKIFNLNS